MSQPGNATSTTDLAPSRPDILFVEAEGGSPSEFRLFTHFHDFQSRPRAGGLRGLDPRTDSNGRPIWATNCWQRRRRGAAHASSIASAGLCTCRNFKRRAMRTAGSFLTSTVHSRSRSSFGCLPSMLEENGLSAHRVAVELIETGRSMTRNAWRCGRALPHDRLPHRDREFRREGSPSRGASFRGRSLDNVRRFSRQMRSKLSTPRRNSAITMQAGPIVAGKCSTAATRRFSSSKRASRSNSHGHPLCPTSPFLEHLRQTSRNRRPLDRDVQGDVQESSSCSSSPSRLKFPARCRALHLAIRAACAPRPPAPLASSWVGPK